MIKIYARTLVFSSLFAAIAAQASEGEIYIQPVASQYPAIELNVNVRDKDGKPVSGFQMKDFMLSEDLKDVALTGFETTDASLGNNRIDVVFVFDDTGSMAEEIEGLKNKTIEFANIIQSSGFDYNLGLISYKDVVNKKYRVTDKADVFKSWVSDLNADGGDDEPENALDAINEAAAATFRDGAEVIFVLITDATFHASDSVTSLTMHDVVNTLKAKNIKFHTVGPNIDQYKVMTADLGGTFYDKDSGQFQRIVTQIAGGSSGNYRLTFNSPRPEYDFTWRALELKVQGHDFDNGVTQYQAPSWVTASSRKDALKGGESSYAPHYVVDGSDSTGWVEGVSGSGIGEWLAMNFNKPEAVGKFAIRAGSGSSLPTTVAVQINGGEKRFYSPDASGQLISGEFDREMAINQFKVSIVKASASETGFGEVELYSGKTDRLIEPIRKAKEARMAHGIALELNSKGEELYHAKKYEDAIYHYKEAIDKDPSFAQAYSNLGLAYQRVNDYPNAIWANRKAIALARGKTRNVVSASSYYNIARIFEAQNKYEEALQNFYWAMSFRSHNAYDAGVARMKEKLGL
ncbi:NADase-type glycan-binding domain-containing protein [Oceanobacter mangrovi]|uniref:NADase-type glycan-binding domain-containing protein n=1 Tax=Oceanobacter mangrovi TaxID=2862510 RepID=UPI001C8D9F5D|nr:tetratricopeptide repeat protein [Oceanobacter mangrovi]